MSYPTILLSQMVLWLLPYPLALWFYFTLLATAALLMIAAMPAAVVSIRELRENAVVPPGRLTRIGAGMLALAACMDIGALATLIQLAYLVVFEVLMEKSYV